MLSSVSLMASTTKMRSTRVRDAAIMKLESGKPREGMSGDVGLPVCGLLDIDEYNVRQSR